MSFVVASESPQVNKDKEKGEVGIQGDEGTEDWTDGGDADLTPSVSVMLTCPAPPGPVPPPSSPLYK